MNTFPDIQKPSTPLKITPEDTTIRSTMEDGTVVARRKFTKIRNTYVLTWDYLSNDDYVTLMDFLENTIYMGALPFTWTQPMTGKTKTVIFISMEDFETKLYNKWSGSITLEDV